MAEIVTFDTEIEQGKFSRDRETEAHAEEQYELFKELYRDHKEYIDEANRFDRFYRGDQWKPEDLAALEKTGRPALTLNMILSTINTFLGEQITRRVSLHYKAKKQASAEEAHALSAVAMAVMEANQYDWKESEMVEDGVIRDRGFLNFRVEFDTNFQGEIKIDVLHPDSVLIERNSHSYDPADWKGVTVATWESLNEIEERFGKDKRDEVERYAYMGGSLGTESVAYETGEDPEQPGSQPWDIPFRSVESRRRIKSVRLLDRQYYKMAVVYVLIDPETMEQRDLKPGTTEAQAKAIGDRLGVFVRRKNVRRLYWRVTCDRAVLWEGWSPYRTPTVIPYFPYLRKGQAFGIVRNLISPQEQYNKVSSQELHIVNGTANSGWVVRRGGLMNMTVDELASRGAETGLVVEAKSVEDVKKIQPNQIPTGISHIKRDTQMSVRSIAGMSDSFVGADSAEVSGVALKSREQRGQVQIQKPLDNLARSRYLVGRKMLELIQDFYTDARIVMATDYSSPGQPEEQIEINMPQPDGSILNEFSNGEYGVSIATMPARDSYDDSQFAEVMNMISVGIPIPGYHAVRYSHLAQKDQIAEEMKAMAGLQAPTPEEQEMQQIQQQLALQDMQMSIAEKQAKVQVLLSQVDLTAAKTANELTAEERELRQLMKELESERESYKIRLQLAQLQGMQKMDTQQMKTRGDLLKQQLQHSTV